MQFLLTTFAENSTMEIVDFVNKGERQGYIMAAYLPAYRELYIDVAIKESQVEEIFLYRVDFNQDRTFRTKEYLYKKEEPKVTESVEGEELLTEQPLSPDPLELFKEQWELLCGQEVPTEVYATDAEAVMNWVFAPLVKKYPDLPLIPEINLNRELIQDCVSMGRVISMSVFDEQQHLAAGIRRRIKERYHEYVDEIKAERNEHIFICRTMSQDMPVLLLSITDKLFKIKKQVMLNCGMKEETLAVRLREILSLYPEADIIVEDTSMELYRLFCNINQFMGVENKRRLFSVSSMLSAMGKSAVREDNDLVGFYVSYIRNQEEMRLGTFLPERLYSVHKFYLPVQISSEKAWIKQFKKNTVWKQNGRECYQIMAEGDLKGKYILKADKEHYVLKLRKISIQRYLKKYAVLRLEVENYCYPGEHDKKRINELASGLFTGEINGVDSRELKLKNGKQAYSLTTVPVTGNENQLWMNGLLQLGCKKKTKAKKALTLSAMKEKMYCIEEMCIDEEELIIQNVLIRDGMFCKIEDALAKTIKPEKSDRPAGRITRRQKKEIKDLFDMYRYIVVSFGEGYETSQDIYRKIAFDVTEEALGTQEVKARLKEKFGLFF